MPDTASATDTRNFFLECLTNMNLSDPKQGTPERDPTTKDIIRWVGYVYDSTWDGTKWTNHHAGFLRNLATAVNGPAIADLLKTVEISGSKTGGNPCKDGANTGACTQLYNAMQKIQGQAGGDQENVDFWDVCINAIQAGYYSKQETNDDDDDCPEDDPVNGCWY